MSELGSQDSSQGLQCMSASAMAGQALATLAHSPSLWVFPFPTDLQPQRRQGLWPGSHRPDQLEPARMSWSPQGCPGPSVGERGCWHSGSTKYLPFDGPTPSPRLSPGIGTSVLLRPSKKSVVPKAIWEPWQVIGLRGSTP